MKNSILICIAIATRRLRATGSKRPLSSKHLKTNFLCIQKIFIAILI